MHNSNSIFARSISPHMQRKKRQHPSYAVYLRRVLKRINKDTGISTRGMAVMDTLARNLEKRLSTEAAQMTRYKASSTLGVREFETATSMIMPNSLAKQAKTEGTKALNNLERK